MSDTWKDERIAELCTRINEYKKSCEWKWDAERGEWKSACFQTWPAENNYLFCPGCGKRFHLEEKPDVEVKMVQTEFILE